MSYNITVKRLKLLEQLETKRAEILAYYEGQRAFIQAKLDELESASGGWADYYQQVANGLRNNTLTVLANGKLKAVSRDASAVPEKPNASRSGWGSKATLLSYREQLQPGGYYESHDLSAYQNTIALLQLSEDEDITITADSGYGSLVTRQVGRGFGWEQDFRQWQADQPTGGDDSTDDGDEAGG